MYRLLCKEDRITKKKKLTEKYGMQMTVELEEHVPKERIIAKLQKRFQLEQSRAEEYFDEYAPVICR